MRVLFLDAKAPSAYDGVSGGTGGSERSLIVVAEGLAASHEVVVIVARSARGSTSRIRSVVWHGLGGPAVRAFCRADVVIVQRQVELLPLLRLFRPFVRLVVWHHDLVHTGGETRVERAKNRAKAVVRACCLRVSGATSVMVSEFHRDNWIQHLRTAAIDHSSRSFVLFNPVESISPRADALVDRDKLVFPIAAWKGLPQVLSTFYAVRAEIPNLHLVIAAPDYGDAAEVRADGVVNRGRLTREELYEELSTALCLFYPASAVPETFGVVLAESHALGTPVLAHPFGAAAELLQADELVDAADVDAIATRLRAWRNGGRPFVRADERFASDAVSRAWDRVLETVSPRR